MGGVRGRRRRAVARAGQPVLPLQLLLHRHLPGGRPRPLHARLEARASLCHVRSRHVHARLPGVCARREHADRGLLVLPAPRCVRGRDDPLPRRQDCGPGPLRARVVRVRVLDGCLPRAASLEEKPRPQAQARADPLRRAGRLARLRRRGHGVRPARRAGNVHRLRRGQRRLLRRRNRARRAAARQPGLLQIRLPGRPAHEAGGPRQPHARHL